MCHFVPLKGVAHFLTVPLRMFKKRSTMKEPKMDPIQDNTAENLTTQPTEEQLAENLNTDENRAGSEGLDDTFAADGDSKLQNELTEAKDKYLRLAAEFENYKRRTSRERIELTQTAGRDIIQSLLDVLDDSERAAKNMETTDDIEQIKQGVMLVFNKLKNTLQNRGLKAMESQGVDFDPELHEAVTEVPVPDQAGKVVDVIMPGYYLNDKLIRHAKVIVGKQA
jgi:molecular chaperone GrpE